MKKTLLTLTVCILASIAIKAQVLPIRIMPQVGLNLTKVSDNEFSLDDKFKTGFEIGAWIQTKKTVFIMPGFFYAKQGLNEVYVNDFKNGLDTVLNNVDYQAIKVPVMVGIQFLGLRAYTGPSFTCVINDNTNIDKDIFKDVSMGFCLGAGANVGLFSFDLRYEYGISDVFIGNSIGANALTISAGLKF